PTAPVVFDVAKYMAPPRPRPLETDEARMELFFFLAVDRTFMKQQQLIQAWRPGFAGGLVGTLIGYPAAGPAGAPGLHQALSAASLVAYRAALADLYIPRPGYAPNVPNGTKLMAHVLLTAFQRETEFDDNQPGPAFLGIRAARRSLAVNPED